MRRPFVLFLLGVGLVILAISFAGYTSQNKVATELFPVSATYISTKALVAILKANVEPVCDTVSCRYVDDRSHIAMSVSSRTQYSIEIESLSSILYEDPLNQGIAHLGMIVIFVDTKLNRKASVTIVDYLSDGVIDVYMEQVDQYQESPLYAIMNAACKDWSHLSECVPAVTAQKEPLYPEIYEQVLEAATREMQSNGVPQAM